jgi:hypothetical protein
MTPEKAERRSRCMDPVLLDILNGVDRNYYKRAERDGMKSRSVSPKNNSYSGKRYECSRHGASGLSPSCQQSKRRAY